MSHLPAARTETAEIHSHTTASDGQLEPAELAALMADRGVEVWALTDHDNCFGCPAARKAADRLGLTFIPGLEISAYADERSVHVLGYGVDPESPRLVAYARRRQRRRVERTEAMIAKLAELGVSVELSAVEAVAGSGGVLGRPHLGRVLVAQGVVDTLQEAFDTYLAYGKPAYVGMGWPSVEEAIGLIDEAGGFSVLAHPAHYELDDRIAGWAEAGLRGVEVIHPDHDADAELRYARIADDLGLLKTASSDFHGPAHRSAAYFGQVPFPVEWLDAFLAEAGQAAGRRQ